MSARGRRYATPRDLRQGDLTQLRNGSALGAFGPRDASIAWARMKRALERLRFLPELWPIWWER